ncbi:unnamed protein product [Lepeophtheirus salmonis]|uniref:(salmon louse) hypothetical protein n=1 Tax=Lepeophtheirus salmonis TaxID=72036 RepID=A0A7R8HA62_LEPSM|nr:unnamed protein product [Lepeophtheirus salmonis]CAF2971430.1 unnamed protein product [Lepeophtheirus salmonis]
MDTTNEEGQLKAFHSLSVVLKALHKKPIPKIRPLQTDKKSFVFGLFSHVKPNVQRETQNSRKSDEEGEELGNMKFGSHDPHLEDSAADNNKGYLLSLENLSSIEEEFSLGTKSEESFPAHPEEYIHIKKYQELLQKLKKVKDMNYSLQIQLEVQREKIVELKKKVHQRDTRTR